MNPFRSFVVLTFTLVCLPPLWADDLQPLSDEFDDPSTLSRWDRLYQVEGWSHDQLETWDIDTTTPGEMRMMPYTSSWYHNLRGVLVHKPITGNFVVTARLLVGNRTDSSQPPSRHFSLAGIFVHRPIPSRTNAAPTPVPVGPPTWPLPDSYTTDWLPGEENYIFLSFGAADSPNTRQYEVKTTRNSDSQLYFENRGVPDSPVVELQLVIVGQSAVTLRRHPGGSWIVENRYTIGGGIRREIPDFDHDGDPTTPHAYQVGITTYTDWLGVSTDLNYSNSNDESFAGQFHRNYSLLTPENGWPAVPDLIADIDYVRFGRPHPDLTEALLQALPVDFDNYGQSTESAPLAILPADGAGQFLGDHADTPSGSSPEAWHTATFTSDAGLPSAAWTADFDGGGLSNLFEYLLGGNAIDPADDRSLVAISPTTPLEITFTPDQSVASQVNLSAEKSTDLSEWTTIATKAAGSATWAVTDANSIVSADPLTDLTTISVDGAGSSQCFVRLRATLP